MLFATGLISATAGIVAGSSVDFLKAKYNAHSLKPDNNIHIYALEGNAVIDTCTLDLKLLKSMARDAEALMLLAPKDKFAVETYAKNSINKVGSDQITGELLKVLKDKHIASCPTIVQKPLDSLQIAVVVEKQIPYIYKRPCDVLYRPNASDSIKIGEVDIHEPVSGTTTSTIMPGNNDIEKYKILKDTYTSFRTLRITPGYHANIEALRDDLNNGHLNVGLRCEFLYDKELKPKDVDYRKAPINKL